MLDKNTLLEKYGTQSKIVTLKSVEADVKIQKLTIAQRQEVNDLLFGESKMQKAGKAMEVEVTRYQKASKLAVSYGLVDPKLTTREIEKLSEDAADFVDEVFNAIQEFDVPKK